MKYEVNECCGCASPGYPCLGDRCNRRHTIKYVCDICGTDDLDEDDIETDLLTNEDVCRWCRAQKENEEDEE